MLFCSINKAGRIWGTGFGPQVIWGVAKQTAKDCEIPSLAPRDLRRTWAVFAIKPVVTGADSVPIGACL